MKINSVLVLSSIIVLLSACSSNTEYAYNEKTASTFLKEMNNLDENHLKFIDTAKVFHLDESTAHNLNSIADYTVKNATTGINDVNELQPSETAMPFHNGVIKYFNGIVSYGKIAKELVNAKELSEKNSLFVQLEQQYNSLKNMPDSILEIQKVYLEKADIEVK